MATPSLNAPRLGKRPDGKGTKVVVVGLWRRLTAALLDTIFLAPVLVGAGWLAFRVTEIPIAAGKALRPELILELVLWGGLPFYSVVAVAVGLTLLYGFLFTVISGFTPGLRLLRGQIINIYGNRPEWWRVLLRCLGLIVGLLLLGLGLLWIGFDRQKRGLHDWLAGTYVIRQPVDA